MLGDCPRCICEDTHIPDFAPDTINLLSRLQCLPYPGFLDSHYVAVDVLCTAAVLKLRCLAALTMAGLSILLHIVDLMHKDSLKPWSDVHGYPDEADD